jgi:hypothetical protein
MFDLNNFDFGERHFPYWPNQLYRIIDNKLAAEFKAASDICFEVSDDPDDGACKRILEDHLIWSPQSASWSIAVGRTATEHEAEKRIRRGNGRVRIATIDVSRAMQHIFCGYSART